MKYINSDNCNKMLQNIEAKIIIDRSSLKYALSNAPGGMLNLRQTPAAKPQLLQQKSLPLVLSGTGDHPERMFRNDGLKLYGLPSSINVTCRW